MLLSSPFYRIEYRSMENLSNFTYFNPDPQNPDSASNVSIIFMPLRDCSGQPHYLWPQDPSIPSLPLPQAGEEPADHIPVCVPGALGSQRRDHGPVGWPWWAQRAAGEQGLEQEPGRGAPSRILHLGCHRR